MTIKQCKFIMLCCHYYALTFNWKWGILYEKQDIQWKHYSNVQKLFKVYNTTYDHYSPWAYCAFIQMSKCIYLNTFKWTASKYAFAFTDMQASHIICILNLFAVKYIFLVREGWNKVVVSELFTLYDSFPVTL